jgi:hypothetical protein
MSTISEVKEEELRGETLTSAIAVWTSELAPCQASPDRRLVIPG